LEVMGRQDNNSCWVLHWADPEKIKERTVKIS
jgi:hypothetical protein